MPLTLPTVELDFATFFERIAAVSLLIRMQLVWQVATDDVFAAKMFKAFSATAKLKVAAALLTAESVEVG